MTEKAIKKIFIAGGGTSGWMVAAALAALYKSKQFAIQLVESAEIGTVGVGEATVPHIRFFNARLGIDEREFMQKTSATFKLGIEFRDWNRIGDAYIHPFGAYGRTMGGVGFHHHWLRSRQAGIAEDIGEYSFPVKMAEAAAFVLPTTNVGDVRSTFSYAYQFDAGLYAAFLSDYAQRRGVVRTEGKIVRVEQHPESGFVVAVLMENGERIEADLFIDCSGFRGLLIEETLKTGYDNWNAYLPCDRAWAVPCERGGASTPYTRATAREAGWQWRIPLQHRVGNGYVFSSPFIDEGAALDKLMQNLEGPKIAEPKMLKFVTGVRRKSWNKNVVAIGLSAGFLEPLESTSIHLIQQAATKLVELMPDRDFRPEDEAEFNQVMSREYESVRDFLILHYHATERNDTPFWNYCRTMTIPESLERRMDLFRQRGVVESYREGFFLEPSWLAVYLGQGVVPEDYDPLSARISEAQLSENLTGLRNEVRAAVKSLPSHELFLRTYCPFHSAGA